MKNFDMAGQRPAPLLAVLRVGCGRSVRRVHHRAFADLLQPLHHHPLPRRQPRFNDPPRARPLPHAHRLDMHLIRRVHQRHLIRPLQFRHRPLRHEHRPVPHIKFHPRANELPRPQHMVRIRKERHQPQRPCRRPDLAVGRRELPHERINRPVPQDQLDLQLLQPLPPLHRVGHQLREIKVPLLRDVVIRLDRIDRRNRRQLPRRRPHQIPNLPLGNARDAVRRRNNLGELQIQRRPLHLGLRRNHRRLRLQIRLERVVILLLADRPLLHQRPVTLDIQLRLPQARLRLRQLPPRLVQHRLERPRIDLKSGSPFFTMSPSR